MTPVKSEDGSSTEEEESETDPTIMDLLSCFKEVSCNGLKVAFDKHKVDFLPSLSAISLMKKKYLDDMSPNSQTITTPMKKLNFSADSTTGTKQYSESGTYKDFDEFDHNLTWSNKEPHPFNRKPIYQELKDLAVRGRMSDIDLHKSWFTVLYTF